MNLSGYITSDTNIAAYLTARGHTMQSVRMDDGRCVFEFTADAGSDAEAYFRNAPISARLFAAALRDLKGLIARERARSGNLQITPSREVPTDDSSRHQ
jgi:hypothetical protein